MRHLSNEYWKDIIRFVPFRCLHKNVSGVCNCFASHAQPLLNKLCPRTISQLIITWDRELHAHQLELIEREPFSTTKFYPFPSSAPPQNIIGFKEIHVERRFDQQVLDLLLQCRSKIGLYNVCFENFGNFMRTLANIGIHLQDVFNALGNDCSFIRMKNAVEGDPGNVLPDEFLTIPQVLNCYCLEIDHLCAMFDVQKWCHWLKWTLSNGTRKGLIVQIGNNVSDQQKELNVELFGTLVKMLRNEHLNKIGGLDSRFLILLYGVPFPTDLQPFEEESMQLCKWDDQHWLFGCNGKGRGEDDGFEEAAEGIPIRFAMFD